VRKTTFTFGLCVALLFESSAVASSADPAETYRALRDARLDGRHADVSGLTLERDVHRFYFDAGLLHLLRPVNDQTFAAVFVGRGRYELTPASESERRHIAFRTEEPQLRVLSDSFERLVLFFKDDAVAALFRDRVSEGPVDRDAAKAFDAYLALQRELYRANTHLTLLEVMLNGRDSRTDLLLAYFDGKKLARSRVLVTSPGSYGDEDSSLFVMGSNQADFWYSSHLQEEVRSGGDAACKGERLVDTSHYDVETGVTSGLELQGTATIRFRPRIPKLHVLPLTLAYSLRLKEATWLDASAPGEERALSFVQEKEDEDAIPAILFPAALGPDREYKVRLRYSGSKIVFKGASGYSRVDGRTSWYPKLSGASDLATFDLRFRVPGKAQVVSVGRRVAVREENGSTLSEWKVEQPARGAGFAYGKFELLEDTEKSTGTSLEVYTDAGMEGRVTRFDERTKSVVTVQDVKALARDAMSEAVNAVQVYTKLFGPLPYKHLSFIPQATGTFGQTWPTLVFLPSPGSLGYFLFGLESSFIDQVGLHEIAHQWWGHEVGFEGYRNEWLSEGLAEFSAGMALHLLHGWKAYDGFLQRTRERLLALPAGQKVPNYEGVPIDFGYRAGTARTPMASLATTYSKGAYVVHMLRMMMRDEKSAEPDGRFITMMQDFAKNFSGKNATTADFQAVVERHMIPEMDLAQDRKLAWFFDQWIRGTEIPRYKTDLRVDDVGGGQYKVHGTVEQQGVSDGFRALVPIYVDMGEGRYGRLGRAVFIGNMSKSIDLTIRLPEKPKQVVVNAHYDVLTLK